MKLKVPRPSVCHPQRAAYVGGKCRPCYTSWRYERRPELREKVRAFQKIYGPIYYEKNKTKIRAAAKIDYQGKPVQFRRAHCLKQRYGLTLEQYDQMYIAQGGLCAICLQPPSGKGIAQRLFVDHCHRTKGVRGLLCARCNTSIGRFGENIETLRRAIAYLEKDL